MVLDRAKPLKKHSNTFLARTTRLLLVSDIFFAIVAETRKNGMKSSNNFQLRKSFIIKTKIVRMTKKPSMEDAYMMSFFFQMAE